VNLRAAQYGGHERIGFPTWPVMRLIG